jgi:transcriptional antiterminator NusG
MNEMSAEVEKVENNHKWYVINTVIGQERKIAKTLKENIEKQDIQDLISEVIVPAEKVTEIKRGKKVDVERKVCPGYILLKMELNDKTISVIRSISGVAKFLGRDKKPVSIPEKEVMAMLNYLSDISALNTNVRAEYSYLPGDMVEIKEGAFEGFSACVEAVDNEKMKLKVAVSIFGRETPVELDFKQASKTQE